MTLRQLLQQVRAEERLVSSPRALSRSELFRRTRVVLHIVMRPSINTADVISAFHNQLLVQLKLRIKRHVRKAGVRDIILQKRASGRARDLAEAAEGADDAEPPSHQGADDGDGDEEEVCPLSVGCDATSSCVH